jgi:glycerate kinase
MYRHGPPAPAEPPSVVVCPDKFRGSLTAPEAAAALAGPFRTAGAHVVEVPLADGGEGFLEILTGHAAASGPVQAVVTTVEGPTGSSVEVRWALTHDGTAIVESARACGHPALDGEAVDPVAASTRGLGEVLAAARDAGAQRAVVGIGGTVTTDGGLGALDALGWDARGLELVVAVDTRVRFLDAARVYAPQKGASPAEVDVLDRRLRRHAVAVLHRTGLDLSVVDGSGAGGGLAGALHALGGVLRPGVEVVAEACRLAGHLRAADLVVTGEGRLDATSFTGKAVGWVLGRSTDARRAVVVGDADPDALSLLDPEVRVAVLRRLARDDGDSVARAAELAGAVASDLAADSATPSPVPS